MSLEHQVEVFTFRSYYKLPTDNSWKINTIDIPFGKTRLGSGVFAPLFIPWHSLRKRLEQFDIVVVQLYPANLIPILPKKLSTKVITVEWGTPSGVWSRWQERLYVKLAEWASGIACRRADKVLVGSKFVQNYVKQKYGVNSKVLCLDGLDFSLLDKDKYQNKRKDNILYIGRISPHKNLHTLIEAFQQVKQAVPNATLTIVGSHTFPRYTEKLHKLAAKLSLVNSVKWAGAVSWEALPQYYADCSVYCSPSLWEGFMRCEAFAFEKPMVVFNNTANAETVKDKESGFVVKENTPEALALALITLLKDSELQHKMGKAGYSWAKNNLDLDIITKELVNDLIT